MNDSADDRAGEGTARDRSEEKWPPAETSESSGETPEPAEGTVAGDGAGAAGTRPETPGTDEQYCSSCGELIRKDAEICPECGVRLRSAPSATEPSGRLKAGVVGGVVSFFLGWVPFVGPIFGGAVAGYLRGNDVTQGALAGLLANVLASIPAIVLVAIFFLFGTIGAAMDGTATGEVALGLVGWLIIFGLSFAYFYGFGAIGGVIGSVLTSRRAPE